MADKTHPDGAELVGGSQGKGAPTMSTQRDNFPESKARARATPSRAADRVCPGGVGAPGACIVEKRQGGADTPKSGDGEPAARTVQIAATGPAASNGPIGAHETTQQQQHWTGKCRS